MLSGLWTIAWHGAIWLAGIFVYIWLAGVALTYFGWSEDFAGPALLLSPVGGFIVALPVLIVVRRWWAKYLYAPVDKSEARWRATPHHDALSQRR